MNYPTWSDLNKESVVPVMGTRTVRDIGRVAVMVSCDPDIRMIRSGVVKPHSRPFFLSSLITTGDDDGTVAVAGPFIGAPYAVMLLESLIARGANKIIVLGWCGAVSDTLKVGDTLLVSKAIVDEGTSRHYRVLEGESPASFSDPDLTDQFAAHLTGSGMEAKNTTVWTTDAIYRETKKKVAYFRGQGASAVEMEFSALYSVAGYRGVQITGLLVVSDSVAETDWVPGFRKKQFKAARKRACEAVMRFAEKICQNE